MFFWSVITACSSVGYLQSLKCYYGLQQCGPFMEFGVLLRPAAARAIYEVFGVLLWLQQHGLFTEFELSLRPAAA